MTVQPVGGGEVHRQPVAKLLPQLQGREDLSSVLFHDLAHPMLIQNIHLIAPQILQEHGVSGLLF